MKTYSVQERTQELLHMLRTHKGVRISGMAEKLSVTERTIRNDRAGLEKELAGIASVSRKQGICSLEVTDPAGLDRFVSLFAGLDSIRDCIPFPQNNQGRDVMIDSPSEIDQVQLDELQIALNVKSE